ncbi:hypothetical protein LCGC14_1536770 [marine sediment metagenome]|uniref:Uncharacterized protein n=1 Tax=marine sediment metagenome TaxID=412755 RepID=A0A0F9LA27_9ZZZZ
MVKKIKSILFKTCTFIFICFMVFPAVLQFIEIPNNQKSIDKPKLSAPVITINSPTPNQVLMGQLQDLT